MGSDMDPKMRGSYEEGQRKKVEPLPDQHQRQPQQKDHGRHDHRGGVSRKPLAGDTQVANDDAFSPT